ncbi:MAG: GAF domain-containing protein [Anaerolineae bacterium]|nr:GAF domain-containing protein [Anaerolineae bacterium]
MEPSPWDKFISCLADICQQYTTTPWQTSLCRVLELFTELSASEAAALLPLDDMQRPLICLQTPDNSTNSLCVCLQETPYPWSQVTDDAETQQISLPGIIGPLWILSIPYQSQRREAILVLNNPQHLPALLQLQQATALLTPLFQSIQLRQKQETLQHQLTYQKNLQQVTMALNRYFDLNDILHTGLERTLNITGLKKGGVYLVNKNSQILELKAQQGLTEEENHYCNPCLPGQSVIGQAFAEQEVIIERISQYGLLNVTASIPLTVDDQTVGVFHLSSPTGVDITPEEEELLHNIAQQLALAVQRGEITAQMSEQLESLRYLFEISAAYLSQLRTNDIIFILLRTLHDLLENTLGTAFYRWHEHQWARVQTYSNHQNPILRASWQDGSIWEGEENLLDDCRQEQMLVLASRKRDKKRAFWQKLESLGAHEMFYFPLFMPNLDFFGIAAVIVSDERAMTPYESALTWATVQQATAAMVRVYLYEASRSGESRLRAILDSSRDGILLIESNQNIRYVNQQALRLLNITRSSMSWEGQSLSTVISVFREEVPGLAKWLNKNDNQLWQPNTKVIEAQGAPTFRTRNQLYLTIQHWPVYSEAREFLGAIILLRDVTDQKNLEKMRDDLFHMLVHDMKNPLTLITNALDILQDPNMVAHHNEVINIAAQNTERILELVRAILEVMHPFQARPEALALPAMLRRKVSGLTLPNQKVVVHIDLPPDFPLLYADPALVGRIFDNILNNALKYIPKEDGVIRITAKTLDEDWAQVQIYNNGPPIPLDLLRRLFEKFIKGEDGKGGYGLGLAFCRMAIEAHEGKIWAENAPQGGVSFFFNLPVLCVPEILEDDDEFWPTLDIE